MKTNRRCTLLLFLAVATPGITAYVLLSRQALSVPYQDDYDAILRFAMEYKSLTKLSAKLLHIATSQTNDYKLVFGHSIVALQLEHTGHLNFAFLTALGNLFLLPIVHLLWRTYETCNQPLPRRLVDFLPISFLFFSLTYWETLNWAMPSLQNIPVILFSLLSIYLLFPTTESVPSTPFLLFSCLSACLAALSSSNAFLLAPLGFFVLIWRRAYVQSVAWCASFLVPLACYHYRYTFHEYTVRVMRSSWQIPKLCYHILAVIGGVFPVPFQWLDALLGVVILVVVVFAIRSRFERSNPIAFYSMIWILGTDILIGWLRGGIASRYSIYAIFLLIFCYSFLRQYVSTRMTALAFRRFQLIAIALSVGLWFFTSITAYRSLGQRREMVLSGIEHYRSNPELDSPLIDPLALKVLPGEGEFERVTLTKAIQQGIYILPNKKASAP